MAICANPYAVGVIPASCGSCYPCRVNRARLWSHRIMLEALGHEFSSFVTLTYAEEKKPKDGGLRKDHVSNWIKRIRKAIYPRRIRYYVVGEYGEKTRRPHYHGALFGLSYVESKTVQDAWRDPEDGKSYGNIVLRELGPESASYISGYVTKKLGSKELVECGGVKEFQRMSLKPGIGAVAMGAVVTAIKTLGDANMRWDGDVPSCLRHSGKLWPIGRYLKRKIREGLGRSSDTAVSAVQGYKERMQELLRDYVDSQESEEGKRFLNSVGKRSQIIGLQRQKVLNFISNNKIFAQKRSLL